MTFDLDAASVGVTENQLYEADYTNVNVHGVVPGGVFAPPTHEMRRADV